jgi:hypothetical protein
MNTTTLKLDDTFSPKESAPARVHRALGLGSVGFSAVAVGTLLMASGSGSFLLSVVCFTAAMALLVGRTHLDIQAKKVAGLPTRSARLSFFYALAMCFVGSVITGATVVAALS